MHCNDRNLSSGCGTFPIKPKQQMDSQEQQLNPSGQKMIKKEVLKPRSRGGIVFFSL